MLPPSEHTLHAGSVDMVSCTVQIKQLSEKDLARMWSLYVKELAVLLWAVDGREAPPGMLSRIQHLVQGELMPLYFQCAPPSALSVRSPPCEQALLKGGRAR